MTSPEFHRAGIWPVRAERRVQAGRSLACVTIRSSQMGYVFQSWSAGDRSAGELRAFDMSSWGEPKERHLTTAMPRDGAPRGTEP